MEYGNLAYDLDVGYSRATEQKRLEIKRAARKSLVRTRIIIGCYTLMVLLSATFMISKNVAEYESRLAIAAKEKELAEVGSYTSQKIFELEQSIDLNTIELEAQNRLGMQRPQKYQTVYVNVKKDDKTELTSVGVEGIYGRTRIAWSGFKKNVIGIFK